MSFDNLATPVNVSVKGSKCVVVDKMFVVILVQLLINVFREHSMMRALNNENVFRKTVH